MREKSEVRGVQSQCVSIDQAVQIDGRLDEYLPGRACAELSRDGRPRCRRDQFLHVRLFWFEILHV